MRRLFRMKIRRLPSAGSLKRRLVGGTDLKLYNIVLLLKIYDLETGNGSLPSILNIAVFSGQS
jgi:hypothetical protein